MDIIAEWKEIRYDENADRGFAFDNINAHAFKIDVGCKDVIAKISDHQEFLDTRYRRVTYRAVAVSRFSTKSWKKTPNNFRFTAKFPKVIPQDKRLKYVEKELFFFFHDLP